MTEKLELSKSQPRQAATASKDQQLAKKIIHVDMDSFYASVELLDYPQYIEKPIAVGGNYTRGVLTTCNYVARQFGVKSAMSNKKALQLCPELIILPVRMELYKEVSAKIFKVYERYTDLIETISLDEAYLDVSNCQLFGGSATLIAEDIRKSVFEETKLTASAGIAPNKFLAKICSELHKPNGQYVLTPAQIPEFMPSLSVSKIWGIGKKSTQILAKAGIYTCGDVQKWTKFDLENQFGKMGRSLHGYARGVDNSIVTPHRERKSISVERTFEVDVARNQIKKKLLLDLYGALLVRLAKFHQKEKLKGNKKPLIGSLVVKVKFANFEQTTREQKWHEVDSQIFINLMSEALTRKEEGVRLLGLGIKFQSDEKVQLDLFQ